MSAKSKGTKAERDLIRLFWSRGWAAMRSAGSGSQQYPSPDVLAGKDGRRLAIECKVTKEKKKYFAQEEIRHLQYFAQRLSAEAWLAVKFPEKDFYFFHIDDLQEAGKSYVVSLDLASTKGLRFVELVDE